MKRELVCMSDKLIAVIDDEKDVRETVCELVELHTDSKTKNYSSLEEFLAELDENSVNPNVVLSDIHMPTGSGLRLTQELVKRNINIPIIFMSSMVAMIPKQENVIVLRKPIIIDTLLEKLSGIL